MLDAEVAVEAVLHEHHGVVALLERLPVEVPGQLREVVVVEPHGDRDVLLRRRELVADLLGEKVVEGSLLAHGTNVARQRDVAARQDRLSLPARIVQPRLRRPHVVPRARMAARSARSGSSPRSRAVATSASRWAPSASSSSKTANVGIRSPDPDLGGLAERLVGERERRHALRNPVEHARAVRLLLGLEVVPERDDVVGGLRLAVAEDVRMPSDHLRRHVRGDILDVEVLARACAPRCRRGTAPGRARRRAPRSSRRDRPVSIASMSS